MESITKIGLVLSVEPYQEKNARVQFLCEDGLYTCMVRSLYSPKSKLQQVILPFCLLDAQIIQRKNAFDLMVSATIKKNYLAIYEDLKKNALCTCLMDALVSVHDCHLFYHECLAVFDELTRQNTYFSACWLVKKIIEKEGFMPYVDGCVRCFRKDHIETLSLKEGGFLCVECNQKRYVPLSKEELKKIYALFKAKEDNKEVLFYSYEYTFDDLMVLLDWFVYYQHSALDSYRFLNSIRNL